ncbi:MAG: putative peptidoglycan glycosyltransferase FtsW [Hyphomicrobiales bacterium]|nr:putative peptidoglycan glycosyltransferase FtsW [Hyphomicrobiales bacterium]MCY4032410.1 putative peptidoglycan glycosyltransferase FtsW [Hyphomicrobiales bacterium]MCY4038410.1 putative peptidoglycan glycosyltransferase FtsW [Hyphomicrobiales bacterium]
MTVFARTDRSLLAHWWWTIDRWILAALMLLLLLGFLSTFAAGPAASARLDLDPFYFVYRQSVFLGLSLFIILALSLLRREDIQTLGIILFVISYVAMILTLWVGTETRGAARWLQIGAFTLQPSEFLKPGFVILMAALLAPGQNKNTVQKSSKEVSRRRLLSMLLPLAVLPLLALQPDIGQAALIFSAWCVLLFLDGIPILFVLLLIVVAGVGAFGAYIIFPHVSTRVDRFFNPGSGETYQADRALEAFQSGGLFGRGPGEGEIKYLLPDAHTDYVLAVIGEEYGGIVCIFLLLLFSYILLRGFSRFLGERDVFIRLAACGLLFLFGMQTLINMSVNFNLLPPKGMTLPFLSYGGSSCLAVAITMGMVLALSRARTHTPLHHEVTA